MTRRCTIDLTLDLTAPHCARTLARLALRQWGVADDDALDGTAVVVTELVTNALVHGDDGGAIRLELELVADTISLSVFDGTPTLPLQRVAAAGEESGRGLSIVDQLTSAWGVEPTSGGKRVYAHLPIRSAHCA